MNQNKERTNETNQKTNKTVNWNHPCTNIKLIWNTHSSFQCNISMRNVTWFLYTRFGRQIDDDSEWGIKNCHSESISLSLWYCWMSDIYISDSMMMHRLTHRCTGIPCIETKKTRDESKNCPSELLAVAWVCFWCDWAYIGVCFVCVLLLLLSLLL